MGVNIALICFKYPPEYSGYGKQLKSVTNKILEKDSNISFKLLTAYNTSLDESKENFEVISLGGSNIKKTGVIFYLFCIKVFFWLIFNRDKYDVIHCIKAGPEAVVCNFASKILNKPLIVKVAQDELSDREISNISGIKLLLRKVRHFLIKNSDNFIAISEEIKENLLRKISKDTKIIRIPNGVDTDHKFIPPSNEVKTELRTLLKLPKDDVIVLFVGAINRRKGIYDLIEAVKDIKVNNDFSLVICGPILENVDFDNLIKEINESSQKVNIIYKGKVNNVDEYMKASDIFVLPSYSEGLPNVLLEAASCGLALIATDIGGSREIAIDSINGYLVPVGDFVQLGNRISDLVDNIEKRTLMSHKSREIAMVKYSLDQIAYKYLNLYQSLNMGTNKEGE